MPSHKENTEVLCIGSGNSKAGNKLHRLPPRGDPMIRWIANARIIAVFAVVLLHVSAGMVVGTGIGSDYWWVGNAYDSLTRWCVPVLVMVSGALLLDQNKKEDISIFYKKRFFRIFWPILFWSVFYLFWVYLKGLRNGDPPSLETLAASLLSGKPYIHMWFLYMILGLYLFTPFIRKIVAHSTTGELVFLASVMFLLAATNTVRDTISPGGGSGLFINWFLYYLPYFILGHIIRQTDRVPSKPLLTAVLGLSFVMTSLGCYVIGVRSGLNAGLYFYHSLSVTVIPMSISIMFLLKTWGEPAFGEGATWKIASLTLGVYLVHPVIIEAINYLNLGAAAYQPLVSIPVTTMIVFAAALAAAWGISRLPLMKRII